MREASGKLADPAWRRARAQKARKAQTTLDYYVDRVIKNAPALTAEQVERLRQLLPAAKGGAPDAAA